MANRYHKGERQNVSVIVALAGGTGAGKTKTAMELATGLAGGKPFAVIDTESGRASHYAPKPGEIADGVNTYDFEVLEMEAPFSPMAYTAAIQEGDEAHFPVIVIDQLSYEHAGDGGLLDMAEAELDRMAGDNYEKRQACLQASWIKPKREHKRMMRALTQTKAHLILCFRAEEKTEMKKVDGKWKMVPMERRTGKDGWIPICEKNIPFEATCSFLLTDALPGVPIPIKLQGQHKEFFPLNKPISQETGRQLASWASGATKAAADTEHSSGDQAPAAVQPAASTGKITADQHTDILDRLKPIQNGEARLKRAAKVNSLWELPSYDRALEWISTASKSA